MQLGIVSFCVKHVIFRFHAASQNGATGAYCLQKAGVEIIDSTPYHLMWLIGFLLLQVTLDSVLLGKPTDEVELLKRNIKRKETAGKK